MRFLILNTSEYTLTVKLILMISEPTILLQHSRSDHWRNIDTHKAINNIVSYLLGVLVIVLKENKILQGKAEDRQSRGMQKEKLHCGVSIKADVSLLHCKDMIYTTVTLSILWGIVYKFQVRYRFSSGTPFTPYSRSSSHRALCKICHTGHFIFLLSSSLRSQVCRAPELW